MLYDKSMGKYSIFVMVEILWGFWSDLPLNNVAAQRALKWMKHANATKQSYLCYLAELVYTLQIADRITPATVEW